MIRPIRCALATVLAAAAAAGCAHQPDGAASTPAGAAPVTTIYYLPQASDPPTVRSTAFPAVASSRTPPLGTATAAPSPNATAPATGRTTASVGGSSIAPTATDPSNLRSSPPPDQMVTSPKYRVDQINRSVPAEVAWAYVTLLYTHASTDRPGAGNLHAASYATVGKAAKLTLAASYAASTEPARTVTATITVSKIDVFMSDNQATVVVTASLQQKTPTVRAAPSFAVDLTLLRERSAWAVSDDHRSTPN